MNDQEMSGGKVAAIVSAIIFGLLVLITVLGCWFTVSPGERAFTMTLGSISSGILGEWFHTKMPWVEDVIIMDVRVIKAQEEAKAASKDLQNVDVTVAVNYSLEPGQVIEIYKKFGTSKEVIDRIIAPSIQEVVKATTAKYTAEELITKRNEVSTVLQKSLMDKIAPHGIKISDVNIMNFQYSEQFNNSIEAKVKAEQDALTSKNTLEKIKYDVAQRVAQAEGEAKASIAKAQAEAQSIRIQSEAIKAQGGSEYLELKRIEKWNGVYPITFGWNPGLLMSIDSIIKK